MNEWQKDWFELFDTIADQVEGFFLDVALDVTEALNGVVEFSEEVSTQLNTALSTTVVDEVEQYLTEWVSPVLEAYFGLGGAIEEITQPMTQTFEPMLKQHPACVGCRNFHGQYYGDSLLICAMHPYGVGEGVETCPDKEAVNWSVFGSHDFEGWS